MTLSDWSESTFRRRFADGTLARVMEESGAGRAMVEWAAIRPLLAVPWPDKDLGLLLAADGGDAAAQREVGLALIERGRPKGAIPWLTLAAKRSDAEAAYWLSRLHLWGEGASRDPAEALRWLAEAARLGNPIAARQIASLSGGVSG